MRHLEPYGYIDQNQYLPSSTVDLSEIYKVNAKQDTEIEEISSKTQTIVSVDMIKELSGNVETAIAKQEAMNKLFANTINTTNANVKSLESASTVMTESINKLIDAQDTIDSKIDTMEKDIDLLNKSVSAATSGISQYIQDIECTFNRIDSDIQEINLELTKKIAKDDADALYASIGNVYTKKETYTKEEVDSLIGGSTSDAASKTWVNEQGFLTETSGDSRYFKKDDISSIEETVEKTVEEKMKDSLDSIKMSLQTCQTRIDTFNTKVDNLSDNLIKRITSIEEKISSFVVDTNGNIHITVKGQDVCLNTILEKLLDEE